jgi:hypothetical protein
LILLAGLDLPRELDGERSCALPTPGRRARLGPGPHTLLAVGDGARAAVRWAADPAARAELDAVLLVNPRTGGERSSLAPWGELAREARDPGGPLLGVWTSYHAPLRRPQRHPYDAFSAILQAAPPPDWSPPLDLEGLRAWPPGELLAGKSHSWAAPPEAALYIVGGAVLLVDTTPEAQAPEELAALYAPGALVRGLLLPRWRAGSFRSPAARPGQISAARARPRHASADEVIDQAEAAGRTLARGARVAVDAATEVKSLVERIRALW